MSDVNRVLLLVHPQMRPERSQGTERDVYKALVKSGRDVQVAAVRDDLMTLKRAVAEFKPDVVFNLLEEFRDEGIFDFHAVSFLEALSIPYTGCNPRGLVASRNKFWTSSVAQAAGVETPATWLVESKRRIPGASYPLFVKFNREHASLGIRNDNRVSSDSQFQATVSRMWDLFPGELVAQEFVPGLDVTVSVLGHARLRAFPPWQLSLPDDQSVATERIKFSSKFRRARHIRARVYCGDLEDQLTKNAVRMFRALDLSGYARFDFRVTESRCFLVDVNANPNLAQDEDFARSAAHAGLDYPQVLEDVLRLAVSYKPRF